MATREHCAPSLPASQRPLLMLQRAHPPSGSGRPPALQPCSRLAAALLRYSTSCFTYLSIPNPRISSESLEIKRWKVKAGASPTLDTLALQNPTPLASAPLNSQFICSDHVFEAASTHSELLQRHTRSPAAAMTEKKTRKKPEHPPYKVMMTEALETEVRRGP